MKHLDRYSLKARLYPVLIVALPLVLVVFSLQSEDLASLKTLLSVVVAFGGATLLTQISRDAGKSKETKLYEKWGGKPTTQKLRQCGANNLELVKRYHDNIAKIAPDLKLPTLKEEKEKPQKADEVYEVATGILIERTRDTSKFGLVFKENCNYGFRRNLWGLKKIGLPVAGIGSVLVFVISLCEVLKSKSILGADTLQVTCLAFNLALLCAWWKIINPEWIKIVADSYADRLLAATEKLGRGQG